MKMNLFAKIGIIVGILGGLIGITSAIIADPVFGTVFAVIFIGVWFMVYFAFFRPMITANKILKYGEPAEATILKIWDTGVTINNNPQIGMLLEVRPRAGMPYQVESKSVISRLQISMYQPGMKLAVKIDPNDKTKVAVDSLGGGMDARQAEEMMRRQDELNQEIIRYGESAEAKVLRYNEMGINVNGNNPAVELFLEVQPRNQPKFQATAKGVIAEQSISKFQPGEMIHVRFDPKDLTRVSIERS